MCRASNTDNLHLLVLLSHHRWSIPIIAELHRNNGAKFVMLANRLKVSRSSLQTSLRHLIELDLVCRNTGHGHPMRPEYLLTDSGAIIGPSCSALMSAITSDRDTNVAFQKWTLPLVAAIGEQRLRFNELSEILVDATPRAMTLGLKSLLQIRWADRILVNDFPPAAGYSLRPKGLKVLDTLTPLYRATL